MGNRGVELSWSWPLVSYEWLPEILGSLDKLLETSWVGLEREMTSQVPSPERGRHFFRQLKQLLEETGLIKNQGRFIKSSVKPQRSSIVEYLQKLFHDSHQEWATYFRHLSEQKTELHYDHIEYHSPGSWPAISKYAVFKQWSEFFQFLGYGFRISSDHFIPDSAISVEMCQDPRFIEKCLKARCDPRFLTGKNSLHTEADFLSWTKGEDNLVISNDPKLTPRIPQEIVLIEFEKTEASNRMMQALTSTVKEWENQIHYCLKQYPFQDLEKFILTSKTLLDLFIFGRANIEQEKISKEEILNLQKFWKSVPYFKISGQAWQSLPGIYRDMTRLFWGVQFFRNSLKRVDDFKEEYHEETFLIKDLEKIQKLSIRCHKSKRTLYNLVKTIYLIHTSLNRILTAKGVAYFKNEVIKMYSKIDGYLPTDKFELSELINEVDTIINFDEEDRVLLINFNIENLNHPDYSIQILQLCWWVHRFAEYKNNPSIRAINKLQQKVEKFGNRLSQDIQLLNKNDQWEKVYSDFRLQIKSMRNY